MEADLAFRGIDFRDFYAPGGGASRLSWRRLFVLTTGLPYESVTVQRMRAERERAVAAHQRGRVDHYRDLKTRQEAARG